MCSLAQSGVSKNSKAYNYLDSLVLDSGVTDHMTHDPTKFDSYKPSPDNRRIFIADGSPITIAGQGNIDSDHSLTLGNVLHVPKLSTNLLSIHQLIKNLIAR